MKKIALLASIIPLFADFASHDVLAGEPSVRLDSALQCWRYGEQHCCFDHYGEKLCFPEM